MSAGIIRLLSVFSYAAFIHLRIAVTVTHSLFDHYIS